MSADTIALVLSCIGILTSVASLVLCVLTERRMGRRP